MESPAGGGSSNPISRMFLRGGVPRCTPSTCITPSPLQASENPTFSLICSILRSCSPTLAPRCHNIAQDSQKSSILQPRSSNIAPKTLPSQPPGPSGGGPNPKKNCKSAVVLVVFTLRPFFQRSRKSYQKCSQDPPRSSQTEANMVILALSWPILGPTCCQLGPSWLHLRQKSPPNRARNLKKRPQTPQDHPEGRQRAPGQPWGSQFHGFGVDFGLIFAGFSFSLSFYFSWPPCLKFGTVAAWRAQRTG